MSAHLGNWKNFIVTFDPRAFFFFLRSPNINKFCSFKLVALFCLFLIKSLFPSNYMQSCFLDYALELVYFITSSDYLSHSTGDVIEVTWNSRLR